MTADPPHAAAPAGPADKPADEMVDGHGRIRPHWQALLGALGGMGPEALARAATRLERAARDEGITVRPPADHAPGHAPGHAPDRAADQTERTWRCDPVPLVLRDSDFEALAAGLSQRARLLSLILDDFAGPCRLVATGALPASLVYANPGFLRPPRAPSVPTEQLDFYAADLLRGPDQGFFVATDRTSGAAGIGATLENRRLLSRVAPALFQGADIRPLQPFLDAWADQLTDGGKRRAALLSPGPDAPHWVEHVLLSRVLGIALVEGADLTARDGCLYLKTLRGLQPIETLLRRADARRIDPLELSPDGSDGVAGLLDVVRAGNLRLSNDPGAGAVEAPALAAFLPALCRALLGEDLALPSVPTLWLGHKGARDTVVAELETWAILPATDGRARAILPDRLSAAALATLLSKIDARPWAYAARNRMPPSTAPCAPDQATLSGEVGPMLTPRPVSLRLFLLRDGRGFRAMEGGFARVLPDGAPPGPLPDGGVSKDVWIVGHGGDAPIIGPGRPVVAPAIIRRLSGDLPSRVADDLFWLGRYIERVERAARLLRAALARLSRGTLLPRETQELGILVACMVDAGLLPPNTVGTAGLTDTLLAAMSPEGPVGILLDRSGKLIQALRDRLPADMHGLVSQARRAAMTELSRVRRTLDQVAVSADALLRLSALMAGIAAESMVRGGGWLFLDLGRRTERARAAASETAAALDLPAARIEAGLTVLLELRDSVITYRARYPSVPQAAPVLDLVLADPGNPRALAYQLTAMAAALHEIAAEPDPTLTAAVADLHARTEAVVARVVAAVDDGREAIAHRDALYEIAAEVGRVSDRIARRYFTLLPAPHVVGTDEYTGAP